MGEELKMFGFSTGETAPGIKYRTDIDKYAGSCRRLRNWDIDVTGAIVRRKGCVSLSEFSLGADVGTSFFYSGTFLGEKVLILFYQIGEELHASYCRPSQGSAFKSAGKISGLDASVFRRENVRVRQYNDVLFLCGDGLPVSQIRFSDFGDGHRPQTITVYEPREEDPEKSKYKTATLVNFETGEYQWTYTAADPVENPDLTTGERGFANDSSDRFISSLKNTTRTLTRSGNDFTLTVTNFSFATGSGGEGSFPYASRIWCEYPRCFTAPPVEWTFSGGGTSGVPTKLVWKFTDLTLPEKSYCFDVQFRLTLETHYVSTGADAGYSDEIALEPIHFERITYGIEKTATRTFDNLEGGVSFMKFPFSIPPLIGFSAIDGGVFEVNGSIIRYPVADATFDDKISRLDVKESEMLALEDTSGESICTDWGKYGASGAKTAGAVSEVYYASGNTTLYFFSSGGRWCGQLALQVSYDTPDVADSDCTWIDVGYITAATDGTLSPAVTFKVNHYNARVRVKLLERSAAQHLYYEEKTEGTSSAKSYTADMGCKWTLRITGERRYYFSKDSGSDTETSAVRLNASPESFSCSRYSVGAFRFGTGYPMTMDIAQQRLWFLSTATFPKYFWASKTDDIANFSTGTENDDGLCFEADSGTPDFARWLRYGKGQFQFGCTQSEGNLVGKDNQYSLNPTSLALENESAWGSANADACLLGDKIFYVKAGGKSIHAQVYDSGRARYVSGEVNVLARHLFTAGKRAVKLAGLRAPDTVLFVLREDGSLARFIFNDEQNVGAWSTYDFAKSGLKAVDICVLYGESSDTLVIMFEQQTPSGKKLYFAGIDSASSVYTDFGDTEYESELITNAMPLDGENSYGGRGVIGKLDLYGNADANCEFAISFDGGRSYRAQYAGISGEGYFSPEADCRRISWSGGYVSEAVVGVRTKCRGDFSLLAIGALIRRSDTGHPPARDKNGAQVF